MIVISQDIVLIYPSMGGGKKPKFTLPPLGIMYLAAMCKREGYSVKMIDAESEGLDLDKSIEKIVLEKPKVLGISVMTPQIIQALEISKKIKKSLPDVKIVLGGAHINSVGKEVFSFSEDVDFLIYGEGEYTFLDLIKNIDKGDYSKISGLIWKKNGEVIVNPPRELIEDLDKLPFPDLDMLNLDLYKVPYSQHPRTISIICSRGCVYRCLFCDAYKTHGRKFRLRSPKNIVDEIERDYKKYHINDFSIRDSTFLFDKKWVSEICDEILKRELKISWRCNSRVDTLDYEILKKMKKSGCHVIGIGVESGSQEVLNRIRKGITIKQIIDSFKILDKSGIQTIGFFMIGNPGDNPQTVRQTINLAKLINPDFAHFSVCTPFPNTDLYDWALDTGALKNRQWYMKKVDKWMGYHLQLGYLHLPGLSPKTQEKLLKKANSDFYFRWRYIWKALKRLRSITGIKVTINGFIELIESL